MNHPYPNESFTTVAEASEDERLHPDALFETVVTPEHVLTMSRRNLALLPKCEHCRELEDEGIYPLACDMSECQTVWQQLLIIGWNRLDNEPSASSLSRQELLGNVTSVIDWSHDGYHVAFYEK